MIRNYFIWSPRQYYHTHPEEGYQKETQGFEYIRDYVIQGECITLLEIII